MITSAIPAAVLTVAAFTGQSRGEVLNFTATWCGPCQQMSPIVARLEGQGYPIRKVDVDKNRALAEKYGISSIPAFVLVVDGREVTRIVGAVSEQQLLGMLGQIPIDPPVRVVDQDAQPRSRNREASTPRPPSRASQTPSGELTRPVAEIAAPKPNTRAPSFTHNNESKPPSGFFGKLNLFGRDKQPQAPQPPDVVRANDDNPAAGSENTLPVRNPGEASVRLHVTINNQTHVGSGTAIDSRMGQTIIVTCGHLFDGWNDHSKIEVDLFIAGRTHRYVGRMIHYDLHADAGLIGIPTDEIVPTAEVAAAGSRPQVGDDVVSIGCSGGAPPSQNKLQVTALNYYQGPDNIECTGVPVQGRSGGGLFNRQGQLVGLCIAADAERQRGAYAGLLAIHDLLASSGLSDLSQPAVAAAVSPNAQSPIAALEPAGETGGRPSRAQPPEATPTDAHGRFDLPSEGTAGSTEVICIIQQRGAPSRIVIVDHPSQKFLSFLDREVASRKNGMQTNDISAESGYSAAHTRYSAAPTRFSTPAEAASNQPSQSQGEHAQIAALQPTALAKPLQSQRYVRSPHAR